MENLSLFTVNKARRISFSALNLYAECPFRYKIAYLDKIHHRVNQENMYVGTILHSILHLFFKDGEITREKLIEIIESKSPRNLLERIEYILLNYFDTNDTEQNPYFLEKGFKVNHRGQILVGKFDRIDKLADGYEIIDYKLGESGDAIETVKNKLQWIFYWVAFENGFKHLGKVKKFSYHFLVCNKVVTLNPNNDELDAAKAKLNDLINQLINDKEFLPKINNHCKSCLLKSTCQLHSTDKSIILDI